MGIKLSDLMDAVRQDLNKDIQRGITPPSSVNKEQFEKDLKEKTQYAINRMKRENIEIDYNR